MTATVHSFAKARAAKAAAAKARQDADAPEWFKSIPHCCAYARMVKADHERESAAIHFAAVHRGLQSWTEADDLIERTDTNNIEWDRYQGIVRHLAALPATTRREASMKRNQIGPMWLRAFPEMFAGCAADDHLFPPSARLIKQRA